MNADRWHEVDRLYHAALEQTPPERLTFLRENCPDEEIVNEVQSLLEFDGKSQGFLEEPAWAAGLASTALGSAGTSLPAGRLLGRYQILSAIGAGGMGEVYCARDLQLKREVAVKILPGGLANDPQRAMRFEREARAASALNHPNIVSVYDVGKENGVSYIVSELVQGETLEQILSRTRHAPPPFPDREVLLGLALQIADALDAAHSKGIVHRDIKPGNIMVTPRGQVKILDFGIAKIGSASARSTVSQSETQTVVTMPGATLGTLSYMSPEQARGEEPDARADLFSFGAVLYEMVTGRRAFAGHTPALIYAAILSENPPPIAGPLGKVIAKALEKDRAARWSTASEMKTALEALRQPPAARKRAAFDPTAKALLAILLALILAAGGIWYARSRRQAPPLETPAPSGPVRRSVAILGFKNLTGRPDAAWLSAALSEMFVTELAAGEKLRTIPGENVSRARIDLSLTDADGYGQQTLQRIHKTLGVDFIVLGSYYYSGKDAGGQVRLDLRLQDSRGGDTLAAISTTGTDAQLLDLVSRTGVQLRAKLAVDDVTPTQQTAVRAELPSNPEAYRLYAEGLNRLRLFDVQAARGLLEKAAAAEPSNAMVHSALAQAWRSLGYQENAEREAKQALQLSAGLSREKRLLIEARYREVTREWDQAAEAYGALFRFFPDNLDYGLLLAAAQKQGEHGKEALATVAMLRKLPPPARDDPRIDIEEAGAADVISDFHAAERLATTAVRKAEAQGAGLLAAKALVALGWNLERLGELHAAEPVLAKARAAFANAGDKSNEAHALAVLAVARYDQGDLAGADRDYLAVLDVYRRSGDRHSYALTLSDRANIYYDQGKLDTATKLYQEALAIQREIGSKSELGSTLGNIGNVLDNQGDLARARKMHEESLQNFQAAGNKRGTASTFNNLGLILWEQGDLAGAKSYFEKALQMTAETGYLRSRGFALMGLSALQIDRGEFADARVRLNEALGIRQGLGDDGKTASTRMGLAGLTLEEGHPAEASVILRQVIGEFHKEKSTDEECEAYAKLALALLQLNRPEEALPAVRKSRELQKASSFFPMSLLVAAVEGRVASAARPATADENRRRMEAALNDAVRRGYQGYAYLLRLSLAELDLRTGRAARGRANLDALAAEASAKGFVLVARKAQAVR